MARSIIGRKPRLLRGVPAIRNSKPTIRMVGQSFKVGQIFKGVGRAFRKRKGTLDNP